MEDSKIRTKPDESLVLTLKISNSMNTTQVRLCLSYKYKPGAGNTQLRTLRVLCKTQSKIISKYICSQRTGLTTLLPRISQNVDVGV